MVVPHNPPLDITVRRLFSRGFGERAKTDDKNVHIREIMINKLVQLLHKTGNVRV